MLTPICFCDYLLFCWFDLFRLLFVLVGCGLFCVGWILLVYFGFDCVCCFGFFSDFCLVVCFAVVCLFGVVLLSVLCMMG